ncbi:kinase-like domain-containing protein [Daedaleopsis nitida]|nr:kinase-like domain-containing protein [Daedaleopsis nitida]
MNCTLSTLPNTIRRYNVVRVLGYSTFGVVYEVLDTQLSADDDPVYCAMNIICKAGHAAQEIDTVRRKIALHSSISSHPSIVTIYDSWEDEEYICLVIDWESGTLAERIGAGVYAGNDELVRSVFLSLVDAVEACHHAGIAYRDLKPEKILVDGNCTRVYLADFGLATDCDRCNDFWAGASCTHMAPGRWTSTRVALRAIVTNHLLPNRVLRPGIVPSAPERHLGARSPPRQPHRGMSPWTEALFRDPAFSRFCDDPCYLRRCTPISDEAHMLVKRMLAYDPVQRISLGELRGAVKTIGKFFDYDVRRMGFRPVCSVRNGAADPGCVEVDMTADGASGIPGRSLSSASSSILKPLNTPGLEQGDSKAGPVEMPPRRMEEDGWKKGSRRLAANL